MVSRNRGGARGAGSGRPGRFALPALVAVAALLAVAPTAEATFHEVSIREVYPGGVDNASYVELQMWAGGQNFVGGRHLVAYNSNGSVNEDFKFKEGVASGTNQATILIADTSYGSAFAGKPDPDESDEKLNLSPAGGAVCWIEGSPPDCVAWGDFTGPLPAHVPALVVGSPVSPAGVTVGKALRRSIAPPCSTLLELSDDSDDSAADFSEQTPNPRDNASPIVEKKCVAPTAAIDSGPDNPTNSTSAVFAYHSTPAGASFECKLDAATFKACEASGVEYPGPLSQALHTFQVRAKDVNGTGTPAKYEWKIDTTPPIAAINSHPGNPDPSTTAFFTYQSTEGASSFECSLTEEGEGDAFSGCPLIGKSYEGLSDKTIYVFKVRATDAAKNQGAPAVFSWEVDTSGSDITPPETFIDATPPNPSGSPTATFAYHSTEQGSTFECKLDGAAFVPCSTAGVTYGGLGGGPHSFQVRAIDPSENVDETPAGYSFDVVLPPTVAPAPLSALGLEASPAMPPQTTIAAKPPAKTRDRTPTFRFRSDGAGAAFQCKVDSGPFKPCHSPFTTRSLSLGRHMVKIRAVLGGMPDLTPAVYAFKVVRRR